MIAFLWCSFHLASANLLLDACSSFHGSFFGGHSFFCELTLGLLHLFVSLETSITDVVVINNGSSLGGGVEEPDKEGHLDKKVKRNEVKDEADVLIKNVDNAKHNPVSEPLSVVVFVVTLKGEEAHEGRVCNTEKASDVSRSKAKGDHTYAEGKRVAGNLLGGEASHLFNLIHLSKFNLTNLYTALT